MTTLLTRPLRRLADRLADLRARAREALAGEVARAVGEAVRDVVEASVGGEMAVGPSPAARRPDQWDDRDGWDDDEDDYELPVAPAADADPMYRPGSAPAAVAAGVGAGRWWLRRHGSLLGAVGVGLLVGLAVLAGGPVLAAGAAVVATAADFRAATDALGTGADRLRQF